MEQSKQGIRESLDTLDKVADQVELLEKENRGLKELDPATRAKVNGLRATIKVLKEEFPEHKDYAIAQLLPQVVRIEL